MSEPTAPSFFLRHEFAIRRLHSLTGIVPLGVYMVVHLVTNASLLNGVPTFQRAVYQIHSFGVVLPIIEWAFIFLPLLFHGLIGVWIVRTAKINSDHYQYAANKRYTWQRWTGMIALVFLLVHVFHMHGWFHTKIWLDYVATPFGGHRFRAYSAASTLAEAMDGFLWPTFYFIGVMACVYHLANGLWAAGITWGFWLTPEAQRRALRVCTVFGLLLALVGAGAWWAAITTDAAKAVELEDQMFDEAVKGLLVPDDPAKRRAPPLVAPEAAEPSAGLQAGSESDAAQPTAAAQPAAAARPTAAALPVAAD